MKRVLRPHNLHRAPLFTSSRAPQLSRRQRKEQPRLLRKKQFLSRFNIGFLTARDPEHKIKSDYGTVQIPETYIINSQGKVIDKIISARNWTDDKMVSYVQSLL